MSSSGSSPHTQKLHGFWQSLLVLAQAALSVQPNECSLINPAFGQHRQAHLAAEFFYDPVSMIAQSTPRAVCVVWQFDDDCVSNRPYLWVFRVPVNIGISADDDSKRMCALPKSLGFQEKPTDRVICKVHPRANFPINQLTAIATILTHLAHGQRRDDRARIA